MRTQPPVYSPLPLSALRAARRMGEEAIPRLRALLEREYEAEHVLLTGSGTQALTLAIRAALDATGGDTVALPAYACYDVASAAIGAAARITFFDVAPLTLAPDIVSLEAALRAGASVAVIAPLYGIPVPWDELEIVARRHGALLIEDAAQGHGASWKGRPLGSLGALSVLSFGRGKGWTGAGGGALLARGDLGVQLPHTLAATAEGRTVHTMKALAQSLLARPRVYGLPRAIPSLGLGHTRYRSPATPVTMSRQIAALALATHAVALAEAERRVARARFLETLLSGGMIAVRLSGGHAGYLRYPVLLPRDCAPVFLRLLDAHGVGPAYPRPLPHLPEVRRSMHGPARCPGAERLVRQLVTLPVHSLVTDAELQSILATAARTLTAERMPARN